MLDRARLGPGVDDARPRGGARWKAPAGGMVQICVTLPAGETSSSWPLSLQAGGGPKKWGHRDRDGKSYRRELEPRRCEEAEVSLGISAQPRDSLFCTASFSPEQADSNQPRRRARGLPSSLPRLMYVY